MLEGLKCHFYLNVHVRKHHSEYFICFVQMHDTDLYKDILLLMPSRYQPQFSYILQKPKIFLLSEKKFVFVLFLHFIVVKLEAAINSFISRFHIWHIFLNHAFFFLRGAVW